jgi:Outer membrane protein beta-barrel domain
MKPKALLLWQYTIIAMIILLFQPDGFSQQDLSNGLKPPGLSLGFGLAPSLSQIKNQDIQSGLDLSYEKRYSLSGYLEIGYFFTKNIGLTSGLNYSSYNTQLSLDSYSRKFYTIDQENENYELRISGNDITENQYVGILGIPICLNMRFNIKRDLGVYVQTGINIAMPLDNKYETSGTFSYSGFFSSYNVLLHDLPEYGFPSDLTTTSNGYLKLRSIIYCALASVGLDYTVDNRFQFSIGASFNKSLESISAFIPPDNFQLTTGANQLNSFMEGSSRVLLQSIGINFGVRYFISDFKKNQYAKHNNKNYLKEDQHGDKVYIEK